MSSALVLADAAIDAGLGLAPTRDLALWASLHPGALGALGAEVLVGSAVPNPAPHKRHLPWAYPSAYSCAQSFSGHRRFSGCASRTRFFGAGSWSIARTGHAIPYDYAWSRDGAGSWGTR